MIKNVYKCSIEEQFLMTMAGIYDSMLIAYQDKEIYLKTKNNEQNFTIYETNEEKKLDIKILNLLENNGFSLDELGTFLYKDVIKDIILTLLLIKNEEEKNNLENALKNNYSQFYLNIAREDKDIGLKTFHKYIRDSFSKINYDKVSINVLKNLTVKDNIHYGTLALQLAMLVMNNKKQEIIDYNKPNVRKLVKY